MSAPFATEYERSVVVSALNAYRNRLRNRIAASVRKGWKPEPGRIDSNAARLATLEEIADRWGLKEGGS